MNSPRAALAAVLVVLCTTAPLPLSAQSPTDLAGSWTLDHEASQFPTEIGFSASFLDTIVPDAPGARGRGRGNRRSAGGGGFGVPAVQETPEDAERVRFLTDEVRIPYEHVTIAVTPATFTITPDRAPARTFHPGRRDEDVTLGPVTAKTSVSWTGTGLVVEYTAEAGRVLRYAYSFNANPKRLIVDTEFLEHGEVGDKVRRVYRPSAPGEPTTPSSAANTGQPSAPTAPNAAPPSGTVPASPSPAAAIDQRPDAALKGLSRVGVVLEALSPDAAKCGLAEAQLQSSVEKHLTDAGLRVERNSDDDTYLYVNVNTVSASAGLCVSRYDVTLYSHTAAKLSHTASPVLLQVELLHKGGIAGGGPAAHGQAVTKGVLEYVDEFSTRIRDASK